MELIQSNWRDIERYYDHTYVKFSAFGDKLFFISGVGPESVVGVDKDKKPFELALDDDAPYLLEYTPPHKAVFQADHGALLLQRKPAKQYKRGLSSDNTEMRDVSTGERVDMTWARLEAFVTKQSYFSLKQAIESKRNGNSLRSYALNSRMSFCALTDRVVIDTVGVATIQEKYKKLCTPEKFANEMAALVQQDPFNIEVEHV